MASNTLKNSFSQLDKSFWRNLFTLAIPISIQQMLTASFGLVDIGMIGQLGDSELASVGLIGKLFFVSAHLLGGLASGASILAAQYFGKQELEGSRRILGIALRVALFITFPLSVGCFFFPTGLMQALSEDMKIIALGVEYIRITAPVHIIMGVILVYGGVVRGIQHPKIPMTAAVIGILINTFLNYLLVFGNLGFPAMGIAGAAYATVISKVIELAWLIGATYWYKLPIRQGSLKFLISTGSSEDRQKLMRPTLPIMFGEFSWSMGILAYYVVYGYIGTEALAAMSLLESLEGVFIQFFVGFGSACAIMLGTDLGASETQKAYAKSVLFLVLIPFAGMLAGLGMMAMYLPLNYFFSHLDPRVLALSSDILIIMGATLFIKLFNMVSMLGVLRSGGDTRYTFMIDLVCMWSIGVPLALLGGITLGLPLQWVYILVLVEEVAKMIWSLHRIKSKRWLKNLVDDNSADITLTNQQMDLV